MGSATTPKVEVVQVPQAVSPGWQNTAYNEIRNGAWAVLLVGVVAYTALRGSISKYMGKHLDLLDTMKDSLSKNADSLEKLSDTETEQTETLKLQGSVLLKQGEAIANQQTALLNIDQRQKETVAKAVEVLQQTSFKVASMADEHSIITDKIAELKSMSEQHQEEIISKLQTIEDLYHASEISTGNKGTIKNFFRGNSR